ncbi:MAG: hypothetical protein V3V02_02315 [Rhizobiaceae bacterium]
MRNVGLAGAGVATGAAATGALDGGVFFTAEMRRINASLSMVTPTAKKSPP